MSERIFNFSAGPAVLPEEVLEVVQENLMNYQGSGLGVMELSHRSTYFKKIIESAEQNLRELLDIKDSHAVLFCTGGATNQFSMVPLNLLQENQEGNYILTGSWAKKAFAEAKKFGEVFVAASSEDDNFASLPKSIELSANPAYLHFTSNNTIAGTQYHSEPDSKGTLLVCDASSDLLHKKIDVSKYGLIYAGAQKNLGPAGVTIVIIRKDLLELSKDSLPTMMRYKTFADSGSLFNTPPTFPIYVVGEVFSWLKGLGGLDAIEQRNREKASLLYQEIDASDFYQGAVASEHRSIMNVTFRLKNQELEEKFISDANAAGLNGLKGHRSVGGMRASIYNAFPKEGVEALVQFMKDFAQQNG